MSRLYVLLLLSSCFATAFAQYPPNEFCFRSCEQALRSSVRFNTTDAVSGKTCTAQTCDCVNHDAVLSLFLCTKLYCNGREIEEGVNGLNETCRTSANVSLPSLSEVDHYLDEKEKAALRHFERSDAKEFDAVFPIVNNVVVVGESLYRLAYDTLDAAYFEIRTHWIYGILMYFFWVVIFIIGLLSHLARSLAEQEQKWERIPENEHVDFDSPLKRGEDYFRRPYTVLKRYVTVPATFGYMRSQNISWWATLPTRIQSITIGIFVLLNIYLCSVNYRTFPDNLYWKEEHTQMWRYIGDRTGVISTANLILIWTFGIRNNTLMWLTGWDFATYNNFHRWVARVATVEAVVHSVAYTVLICDHGTTWSQSWEDYLVYVGQKYFWNGILATVFMSLICGFSIYGFRRNFYETFLILHIILSIGVLVTMWYHVEIFLGAYNIFLYPCFFVWILDRVLRLFRILRFNWVFWRTKAQLTYSADSNILRLTVPYTTSFVGPRPGTYYYISTLSSLQPWESHPFTLSYSTPRKSVLSADSELSLHPSHGTISPPHRFDSPPPLSPNSATFNTPKTPTSTADFESENLLRSPPTLPAPETLTFLIRPYSGFTSRLRTSALHGPSTQRILIDGPYGETQPLQKYDNVLFIVGGAGIAVPLSYLSFLLSSDSTVESVKILWAVREEAFLHETVDTDFRDMLGDERLALTAYVTGHAVHATESEHGDTQSAVGKGQGVAIHLGRPNVESAIFEVAAEVGRKGELAVVACGPGQLADDARRSVVRLLGKGYGKVEYFEESFNW